MKHKLTFFALLMLVITSMSFAQVTNLTHGGTGPYATITLAINNGATVDGDILSVAAGTYAETVVINKAITLRGANYGVDARSARGAESIVSSNNVNGSVQITVTGTVNIDGFKISGSPVKALQVTGVTTNVIVRNNIFESATTDGINLFRAQNATVEYNWVKGAVTSGIVAGETGAVITTALIRYNKVENSTYGITGLQTGSTISYNEVIGNASVGAGIGGQFYNTVISNNSVHGYTNGAGIAFNPFPPRTDSHDVTTIFNNVYGNGYGIYVNQALAGMNIYVNQNQIAGNTYYGAVFDAGGSGTLDARYNWWGNVSGPFANTNPTGTGDRAADNVNFTPWLGSATPLFMTYLSTPSDGAELASSTTFSWYSGVSGMKYRLQITLAADPYFYSPVVNQATTNTYYTVNNSSFTQGASYIWRVITSNLSETVAWNFTNTWHFTAQGLPQPIASYPVGNSSVYANPPTLYWYLTTYNSKVTEYIVKYSTSTFTIPVAGDFVAPSASGGYFRTNSTNTYITIPFALTPGTRYYWRVAAWDGTTDKTTLTNWSPIESFTIYGSQAFVICYPSYPVGGGTIYTNPPTLYWYTNLFAPGLTYGIQYSTSSTFGGTTFSTYGGTTYTSPTTSYSIAGALAVGHWYWRVAASFDGGVTYGPSSTPGDFVVSSSTAATAPTPAPSSPNGGIVVSVTNPTLYWYAYSTSPLQYIVKYSTNPTTTGDSLSVGATTTILLSTNSYVLTGLTPGATYYWQVKSKVVGTAMSTSSSWSTLAWFTVSPGAAAVVPLAGSPINGTPVKTTSTELSWVIPVQSSSPMSYTVQYSKQSDFGNSTTIADVQDTKVAVNNLEKGTTYYWRAQSKTTTGSVSSYSAPTSFKTDGVTAVEEQTMPTEYKLLQNYPNPFNPTTVIKFSIPNSQFVTLKVYDMLGREIRTLLNAEKNAGTYSIDWNADDNLGLKVASGMYIYRITAGNFVATKKMALIK